eukprot:5508166-Pyramimonas_sp.AAC.1
MVGVCSRDLERNLTLAPSLAKPHSAEMPSAQPVALPRALRARKSHARPRGEVQHEPVSRTTCLAPPVVRGHQLYAYTNPGQADPGPWI